MRTRYVRQANKLMNSTNEPWTDSFDDEEPKAAKRARLASPTPSEATSEATSENTVQAMECVPCADQDEAINADADGARTFVCDQPNCKVEYKRLSGLTKHKMKKHGIAIPESHACDQCDFQTKQARTLKRHKAFKHDLGVTWHACDADPGKCDFQAKQASNLYDHIRTQHARVYAQRRKEQEERVRRALVDAGWQEHRLAEAMPPVGHFRREKRIDFKCAKLQSRDTWCRIDFVLGVPNGFVFLEVDEHQHKYGYGDHLSCDMKRMACVMESLAVETNYNVPNLYWLRYNPNAWHVGGETRRMPKADREANLVAWLERFECVASFGIGYAFYDCEAPEEEGVEDEEDEPGALDVLGNGEYNPQYAEVAQNLMDLARVCGD